MSLAEISGAIIGVLTAYEYLRFESNVNLFEYANESGRVIKEYVLKCDSKPITIYGEKWTTYKHLVKMFWSKFVV